MTSGKEGIGSGRPSGHCPPSAAPARVLSSRARGPHPLGRARGEDADAAARPRGPRQPRVLDGPAADRRAAGGARGAHRAALPRRGRGTVDRHAVPHLRAAHPGERPGPGRRRSGGTAAGGEAAGARFLSETPALTPELLGDDRAIVMTDRTEFVAQRVVVTAGAWSEDLLGAHLLLHRLVVTQEQPAHFAIRTSTRPGPASTTGRIPTSATTRTGSARPTGYSRRVRASRRAGTASARRCTRTAATTAGAHPVRCAAAVLRRLVPGPQSGRLRPDQLHLHDDADEGLHARSSRAGRRRRGLLGARLQVHVGDRARARRPRRGCLRPAAVPSTRNRLSLNASSRGPAGTGPKHRPTTGGPSSDGRPYGTPIEKRRRSNLQYHPRPAVAQAGFCFGLSETRACGNKCHLDKEQIVNTVRADTNHAGFR